MQFEWDDGKAEANLAKHGVSCEEALTCLYDPAQLAFYDPEHSDDEDRELLIGHSNQGRLLIVSYTLRERPSASSPPAKRPAGRQGLMKKEYDLKALKVKRRGVLPGLRGRLPAQAKVRVTIALDRDVVEYFKAAAGRGALPYQTQINQALRQAIDRPAAQALKAELLKDKNFIRSLAREVEQR
ncbi:MAG: BrnT family toxin [Stenotrophobium sp.]